MAPFRVNARHFLLTFAQCPLDPNDALYHLVCTFDTLLACRVAQESHQTGDKHLHAWLQFQTKYDCRHQDLFDISGYHPNIQACKNPKKALNYLAKEGAFYDYHDAGLSLPDGVDGIPEPADFESEGLFLRACLSESIPYGYAQQFWRLWSKPDKHWRDETYPGTVSAPRLLSHEGPTPRTTVVVGPSGIGKTTWAVQNARKPCLIASHVDDLKYINSETESIVFDDMDFQHWPRSAQIHLVDQDLPRSINVRYGTVNIRANMQKIFTANIFPFASYDKAIERRITLINITTL